MVAASPPDSLLRGSESANPWCWRQPAPGGFTSRAVAVTDDGIVAGSGKVPLEGAPVGATRAFRWEDGEFTLLGTRERHLRRAIAEYVEHYHRERAHQGLGNRLIEDVPEREAGRVVRRERLGGLLNHYYREAA